MAYPTEHAVNGGIFSFSLPQNHFSMSGDDVLCSLFIFSHSRSISFFGSCVKRPFGFVDIFSVTNVSASPSFITSSSSPQSASRPICFVRAVVYKLR